MSLAVILFFAGLLLLYFGAEYLITGSSRFALSFGVRPLIIGMTIVALATSMPELMVTLFAAVKNSPDIAAGNIIGSNVANIGLIMGATAVISPLVVSRDALRREIPIMIAASILFLLFAIDGRLTFLDGLTMVAGLVGFLLYCLRNARQKGLERPADPDAVAAEQRSRKKDLLLIVLGITGLAGGAELMVRSAVTIARSFGVSELVIGLSIVALGTSLPELAASTISAWKGEADISVGNVIGSNVFNIFFVLGVCAMIRPLVIEPSVLRFELPVMLLFSLALLPLLGRNLTLGRGKGAGLLAGYVAFVAVLFIK
jgi:cation:H+ antiporter